MGLTRTASMIFTGVLAGGVAPALLVASSMADAPSSPASAVGRIDRHGQEATPGSIDLDHGSSAAAAGLGSSTRRVARGVTVRVSVSSAEAAANADTFDAPAISRTGRYVVFSSAASNLVPGDTNDSVDVFVRDRKGGITRRVS